MRNKKVAVIFTGKVGSGKSFAANVLQKKGWFIVSAGDLIRKMCKERGVSTSRKSLQSFGQNFLDRHGEQHFGKLMLAEANGAEKIVFEGIRPIGAVKEIQRLVATLLVYIDTSPHIRLNRLHKRDGIDAGIFNELENNELEKLVLANKSIADLVISNDGCEYDFSHKILGLIHERNR
jgi:dephospho-CoA kinase